MPRDDPETCDTDGCDAEIVTNDDGWPNTSGRLACAGCWEFWTSHGHWPDEQPDNCIECVQGGQAGA